MKPTNTSNMEPKPIETKGLRILRISTIVMTIVMIFGFILLVSLLSLAIKRTMTSEPGINVSEITLSDNDQLLSVTYSSEFTVLLILDKNNTQILRIISNKTGKKLSDNLVSDLINSDSVK